MSKWLLALLWCWAFAIEPGRVVDGDTVDVKVHKYLREYRYERVRLIGINTPERGQSGYLEAKQFTSDWVRRDGEYRLQFCKDDSFGRLLGTITMGAENLNEALLKSGLAKPDVRK